MEERGWTKGELARRLGFSARHLNQLINGSVSITNDTALQLERVSGSTVNFWLNREANYRERLARLDLQHPYQSLA
jgi:HTH-type transcriptional regulator/antitoxin HigA